VYLQDSEYNLKSPFGSDPDSRRNISISDSLKNILSDESESFQETVWLLG
jgi:hypothetical protein